MFNSNCASVPLVANIDGNGNNNGWGDGGWLWFIVVIFAIFGGWGGGFGGFGGNGGALQGYATQADIQRGFDNSTVLSKLDGITNGLCDGFYAQNTALMNGFHGVDNAICSLGYQTQQGFNNTNMAMMQNTNAIQATLNNMAAQNAACCCETQRQIERGFCDTNYNMATQACETRQAIADSTRAVLDFLTQDKIATLQAENNDLRRAASQDRQNALLTTAMTAQTNQIINAVNPAPIPAYTVPNPNVYYGCGCNSGCGC